MQPSEARQRLYKREKLCSRTAIETLFARDASAPGLCSFLAYPLRAVWRIAADGAPEPQFLISVPKRRLRHAVDRVRIRRLVRESWRLHREAIPNVAGLQLGLVYVATGLSDYRHVERALLRILAKVAETGSPEQEEASSDVSPAEP
ncbi:MAG: ribonuclease P protein component [Candidatus Amulumruptor caecigallinarius]|nr:ribonuclease P protein component [Candidatus Amulumruptor caecigallinarius]MCM1397247.1 ribonuclease P protein component [Candidatus Amulumruptor caecigallinarius]MCM1453079.1 ribonuclease P protein component [bacterium]